MYKKNVFILLMHVALIFNIKSSSLNTDITTEEFIDGLTNNETSPLKNIIEDIRGSYKDTAELLVDLFKKINWQYVSNNNKILNLNIPETNNLNTIFEFSWPNTFSDFNFKKLCMSCILDDNRKENSSSDFEDFLDTQSEKTIMTLVLNYNNLMSSKKMHIAQSYLIATICADFAKNNPSNNFYRELMTSILFHDKGKVIITDIEPIISLMVGLLHTKYPFLPKESFLDSWQATIQAVIYKSFDQYNTYDQKMLEKHLFNKTDIRAMINIIVPLPPFAKIKIYNGHLDLSSCCLTNRNILPTTSRRSSNCLIDCENIKHRTTPDLLWGCIGPAIGRSIYPMILSEITELSLYNNPLLTSRIIYLLMHAFPDLKKINIDEALFEDIEKNMPIQEKHILLKTDAKFRNSINDYKYTRNTMLAFEDLVNPSPLIIQCNNKTKSLKNIYKDVYRYYLLESNFFDKTILSERYSLIAQSLVFIFWQIVSKYYLNNDEITNLSILSLIATVCTPFITLPITHEVANDKINKNSEEQCTKGLWKIKIASWLFNKLFIISLNALCLSILTENVSHPNNYNTDSNQYFFLHALCSMIAINCIYLKRSFQIDYVAAFALKETIFKKRAFYS
jgi:hypothetical protein